MAAFIAALGLIAGSFLNVVIVRMPREKSVLWPGSHCPKCSAKIRWWDNIPLLSYLALRGKCRSCLARIPFRYPVVEATTGIVFLAAYLKFGASVEFFVRDLPFLGALVAITFIDLEHRIIPDQLSLGGVVWGLLTAVAFSFLPEIHLAQFPEFQLSGSGTSLAWTSSLLGAAFGFGFFYALAWVYLKLTGRHGLGGGDIKLLAMMGSFIGASGVFSTILISSVFGSVVGIVWALVQKKRSNPKRTSQSPSSMMLTSIPYGPFLVVGGLYFYFLGSFHFLNYGSDF